MTIRTTSPAARARRAVRRGLIGLALLVAAWAAVPAAHAATQTAFTLEGRGWGHGIGMSQYGAYGYAKYGHKAYDFIIKHYYTGVTLGKVGNPLIRVQLRRALSSASVTDAAKYSATWGSKTVTIAGGTTAVVSWSNGSYHLKAGSRSWSPGSPITFVAGSAKLKLLTANANGYVGRYRGKLRMLHLTDGLMVVNTLPLERYLFGVVPRESPSSWPAEALKAQAVAARSYAYRAIGSSGPFDVYCTTASQMYGGADGEASSSNQAVTATKGIVPKYGGAPITAYFFSTSGGHTENIENVWTSASPVAYLKGVSDPYDYASPYHAWPDNPSRPTPTGLKSALGFTKGLLRGVYIVKRGTSPRVVKALLIGSTGTATTDGASIRADLGLRDTWMYFTSISITPSTSTTRTITYGTTTAITGRRYPQLGSGLSFTLHHRKVGGSWASGSLAATAGSRSLAGYTVKYSSFSATVKPLSSSE